MNGHFSGRVSIIRSAIAQVSHVLFLTLLLAMSHASCGKSDGNDGRLVRLQHDGLEITDVSAVHGPVTANSLINLSISVTAEEHVIAWLITEETTPPSLDHAGFVTEKPTSFVLSDGFGEKRLHVWIKSQAGYIIGPGTLLVHHVAEGSEDVILWDKRFDGNGGDDVARSVAIDSDGNIYVVGWGENLVSETSGDDWWLKKFDPLGIEDATNWNQVFDGNQSDDNPRKVVIGPDGSIFVVGNGSNLVSDTSHEDWWIRKFNPDGEEDLNWSLQLNGSGNGDDVAWDLALDPFGNVYVGGHTSDLTASSGEDWLLKRYQANGVEDGTWSHTYQGNNGENDRPRSLVVDPLGNLFVVGAGSDLIDWVCGTFNLCGDNHTSSSDWWIKKFVPTGEEDAANWNLKLDGPHHSFDSAKDIVTDADGHLYIVGYGTFNSADETDWWIKKILNTGIEDPTWEHQFDGNGGYDSANAVARDAAGNLYVVGYGTDIVTGTSDRDWWIKKFSADGTENTDNWNITRDGASGSDQAYAAALGPQGHLYVVGYGTNLTSDSSGTDWWIKKFINDL